MARVLIAFLALVAAAAALPWSTGSGAGGPFITTPYAKGDPRRCAINAEQKAVKYAADKARKEEFYDAMRMKKNVHYAAKRAKKAAHFDANQVGKKGYIA